MSDDPRSQRPRSDRPLRRFGKSFTRRPAPGEAGVEERIRQLDSQVEPLSLAEEIAREQRRSGDPGGAATEIPPSLAEMPMGVLQ
ncbi:MAG: hypothetical protein ACKN9U_07295, partial [Pirellulaceae bacterium]